MYHVVQPFLERLLNSMAEYGGLTGAIAVLVILATMLVMLYQTQRPLLATLAAFVVIAAWAWDRSVIESTQSDASRGLIALPGDIWVDVYEHYMRPDAPQGLLSLRGRKSPNTWFPQNSSLDAVMLLTAILFTALQLAIIGVGFLAKYYKAMTASNLCLLPRLIPAPQHLIWPSRPGRMPEGLAKATGIYSDITLESVGFPASIIAPIDNLPAFSFKVLEVRHKNKDQHDRVQVPTAPSHSASQARPLAGFGAKAHSTDGSDNVADRVPRVSARENKPLWSAKFISPAHILSIFSCFLSIALITFAIRWEDWVAVLAVNLATVGYVSWWHPSLTKYQHTNKAPKGDVMIRTREGAFILIKCTAEVAQELYLTTEGSEGIFDSRVYRAVTVLGTVLLMLSGILLANSHSISQICIGASYIFLNSLYWGIGMLPPSYFWDLSGYHWEDITPADARGGTEVDQSETHPSYTQTLWLAIRETQLTSWVVRSGAAPETEQWKTWLSEAEKNAKAGNRSWPALERRDAIMGAFYRETMNETLGDGEHSDKATEAQGHLDLGGSKPAGPQGYRRSSLRKVMDAIERFRRPALHPGYKRITWLSAYEKPLYIDVREACEGGAQRLEARFRQSATPSDSIQSPPDASSTLGEPQLPAQAHVRSNLNAQHDPLASNDESLGPAARNHRPTSTVPNQREQNRRYLLLCFSTRKSKSFHQIDVTDLANDQHLFGRIRSAYWEIRSAESWTSSVRSALGSWLPSWIHWCFDGLHFFTPKRADFISFTLMPVRQDFRPYGMEPSLPPESEVQKQNWHYYPCPRLISHFHMDEAFVTQMLEPGHAFHDDAWLELFPKKLKTQFRYQYRNTGIGWGIHIIEGINPVAVAWVGLLIFLSSGILGTVASIVAKDVGAGFTIAAWFAGTMALSVTYLQLKEERIKSN